jgi:hypothetical protein
MTSRAKALVSWSSGEGQGIRAARNQAGELDVIGAVTTVTETFGRVSIRGVGQEVLMAQLDAAGLPAHIVPIPYPCSNEIYEARMGETVTRAVKDGVTYMIFSVISPISAPVASRSWQAAASLRCSRRGKGRRGNWRKR